MMMPAFGFSVGDFIAAIGLCTKVAKALKDSSGATAEYQQVIIEIEGLQNALTRLAALEPTESNIDHVNAIRRMALACSLPMIDFLSKLGKYEASMSPFATGNSFRSLGKKAQYAVSMSEEVKTMRAMISGKVISINLLLATHASETLSRNEDRLSTNQESLLTRLEEAKDGMSRIRQAVEDMNIATTTSQEQLRQNTADSTSQLKEQLNHINNRTASTKRSISGLAMGITSISTSITTLCGLGTQILAILRVFPAELRTLLRNVVRTNMQMYAVLLEVHRKIGATPTLALESNIRIEDALGEIRSLPFEWFRHWEPFEGLLRAEFKNRLGAERVERGDFRLVHAKRPTVSMDKNNWSQTITAGANILMLMLITDLTCQESSCPRQSCSGRTALQAQRQAMLTCPECGLRFRPQLMLPESTEANTIEQLQLEEDARLFGIRNEPSSQDVGDLHMREGLTLTDIKEPTRAVGFAERERPRTRYNSTTDPSTSDQMIRKRQVSPDAQNFSPEPPIYAWLADTQPPEDPDSVLRWREAEEVRRAKRKRQNAQDLEVFRNVEIALPLKEDVPTSDAHDSARLSPTRRDQPATGAYMLYRNILDRYPNLGNPLAWRFANINWRRMENLQSMQHAVPVSTPNQTESLDQCVGSSSEGLDSLDQCVDSSSEGLDPDRQDDEVSYHPTFSPRFFSSCRPWRERKICSLPPPPRLVAEHNPHPGYSAKCYLCHETIHLRRKRDWSNHVMDDLLPYVCPISECAAGDDMYARRRDLSAHMKLCHPLETCSQCPFCEKEAEPDSIKHLGHHMEEIAFGVLTTAYEEWSYDDTDSEVSIPPAFSSLEEPLPHAQTVHGNAVSSPGFTPITAPFLDEQELDPTSWDGFFNNTADYSGLENTYDSPDRHSGNYWTQSSHPSSSASSINSQLRHSVADYLHLSPSDSGAPLVSQSMTGPPSSPNAPATPQIKHRCGVCHKCFTHLYSLHTHMYSHPGERPFACKYEGCTSRFALAHNLRRHREVHEANSAQRKSPS